VPNSASTLNTVASHACSANHLETTAGIAHAEVPICRAGEVPERVVRARDHALPARVFPVGLGVESVDVLATHQPTCIGTFRVGEARRARIVLRLSRTSRATGEMSLATLHIEHPISDLGTWLGAFNQFADARRDAGVIAQRIHQPVDDDRYIVVQLDFDTVEAAEQFKGFLESVVWQSQDLSPGLMGSPTARVLREAQVAK
jgi:hypothetical protein